VLQDIWRFQSSRTRARRALHSVLPRGWTHEERWFNRRGPRSPRPSGNAIVWEVAGVAWNQTRAGDAVRARHRRPDDDQFLPPQDRPNAQTHRSWNDIGRWYGMIANAATVCVRRVAIEDARADGVQNASDARRFGWSPRLRNGKCGMWLRDRPRLVPPRLASDIFANRYGDCKEKSLS